MIPDMIHTPYIAPRISVMAPPPVTAERFPDHYCSYHRVVSALRREGLCGI